MEGGDTGTSQDSAAPFRTHLTAQYSDDGDSQAFDLVIDPLTDFQTIPELSIQATSPHRSYNLRSASSPNDLFDDTHNERTSATPSECLRQLDHAPSVPEEKTASLPCSPSRHAGRSSLIYNIIDSHLWSSDVSLTSGGGGGSSCGGVGQDSSISRSAVGGSGGSVGVGSSGNLHRLVVAEVHRFGYHPPCAGSPHDLASCPAAAAAAAATGLSSSEGSQPCKYTVGKVGESLGTCDALQALNEASSALALTETLIGPLKIPPVSKEVLNEVVCSMEKKTKVPIPVNSMSSPKVAENSTNGEGLITSSDSSWTSESNSPSSNSPVTSLSAVENRLPRMTFDTGKHQPENNGRELRLGSLPSVLQPGIHRNSHRALGNIVNGSENVNGSWVGNVDMQPNTPFTPTQECLKAAVLDRCHNMQRKTRVITVPVGMSDHGPVEVYREVHQYPASSITTVVEKRSYMDQSQQPDTRPPSGRSNGRKGTHKLRRSRKGSDNFASKSSLNSESSACISVASGGTLVSRSSSELTPISCSQASSSKKSLSDTHSDLAGPVTKPILSTAIMQMRQALQSVSNVSDNHSDRSSGGGLEAASIFSDTSSNLSTLSDLSGYEDEYIRIKRLVSDAVIPPGDYKKMVSKMNNKTMSKPVPSVDYEKIIRDLQAQKEDLEIQLHRLSIQVQNAVREKELYQQQLEVVQTKVTETNQKQYFEVLKQRANLEGQLEMLKQELENSVYERNQLHSKISESVKECEVSRDMAVKAQESESQMKARLTKYEDTNKELEGKINEAEDKLEKLSKNYDKNQREIKELIEKNEQLEISSAELRDVEARLTAEVKGLKSHVSQLQAECHSRSEGQAQAEVALSKMSSELHTCQTSSLWYQEQLQAAQAARSSLQQELLEARSGLASVTSERDTLETQVQTLVHQAEDGRARAVREKASLVAHLEALQADMAEREAVVSQLERDHGSDTKLMEERQKRLEQDRQFIHKLRLDLSDRERQLDCARDDLKHKCNLLMKYESELKDLRTAAAVNQEVLRERDVRIKNLEETLDEMKVSAVNIKEERKAQDSLVSTLKEEKLKLEVSLISANNEKKEVDDAIIKVREDMTKLSSNFYRMKHDLGAKSRQIELLMKEVEDNVEARSAVEKKCEELEKKVKEDEEKKRLTKEIESLQLSIRESIAEKEKFEKELSDLRRTSRTLEVEKKGLSEAVQLREEQIHNMQGSLESYREAILKKDEELYLAHEHTSTVEKNYVELRRNWEALKEENLTLKQDAEALAEHESLQKKEKAELKESIQKERRFKQNLEKKIDGLTKMHKEEKQKILKEKEDADKTVHELSRQLKEITSEKLKSIDEQAELERKHSELNKEFNVVQGEKDRLEGRVNEIVTELDKSKSELKNSLQIIKTLEDKISSVSKENGDMKQKLMSQHSEWERQVQELNSKLVVSSEEVAKLKKMHSDLEGSVGKLMQEKNVLSSQITSLVAENSHLKTKPITRETLVKESCSTVENKSKKEKKFTQTPEILHKEMTILQTKLSDYEVKLKEATKQKENLQATLKNTKKEGFLMKAKLKELDAMKKRCKELESSNKYSEELNSYKTKLTELEPKLEAKRNELSSLRLTLNEKASCIQSLKQSEELLLAQVETLHSGKRELEEKIQKLEEINQTAHGDVMKYQQRLKVTESERDEWLAKYESLRDLIPERDTSTQPAVQLGPTGHQSFPDGRQSIVVPHTVPSNASYGNQQSSVASHSLPNSQQCAGSSHTDHSSHQCGFVSHKDNSAESLGETLSNHSVLGETTQAPATSSAEFHRTMADLQAQANMTSKVLQMKEQQIIDLQQELKLLRQEGVTASTGEWILGSVHEEQVNDLLETIQILKTSSATCYNCSTERGSEGSEAEHSETQLLLGKVSHLESEVKKKETEVQELQTRITTAANEFREKQRRYESNVRLLTRKLKEHMKGRKSAEKEMQTQAEDYQRLLNEEQQRYAALRCRCIELEGLKESLEGQVTILESEVEEVRGALEHARQESHEHHNNTLKLQKEVGRMQEISKAADNLKLEVTRLEGCTREKEAKLKEVERELQVAKDNLDKSGNTSRTLTSTVEQLKSQVDYLQHQYESVNSKLSVASHDLKCKEEDYCKAQESLSQLHNVNKELERRSSEVDDRCAQLACDVKRLQEEKQDVVAEHRSSQLLLHESTARIAALEDHIKVLEGEVRVAKEELNQVKVQVTAKEESQQVKVAQLEQSVAQGRQEVLALTGQMSQVQQERLSYQSQAAELRTALHSSLTQLKALKAEEEARAMEDSTISSEIGIIPSPSPLDLTALTQLMERSARPLRPSLPLTSLQSCLSSLKAEVNMLQTQLQNKTEELNEGLIPEAVATSEVVAQAPDPGKQGAMESSGTAVEIV